MLATALIAVCVIVYLALLLELIFGCDDQENEMRARMNAKLPQSTFPAHAGARATRDRSSSPTPFGDSIDTGEKP